MADEIVDMLQDGKDRSEEAAGEKWRSKLAVAAGIMALLGLLAGNLAEHQGLDAQLTATKAVDAWSRYNGKNAQLDGETAFVELLRPLIGNGNVTEATITGREAAIKHHKEQLPELMAEAKKLDEESARATKNMTICHDASGLFSFCVVLLSITMICRKRWLMWKSAGGAALGLAFLAYGIVQIFFL